MIVIILILVVLLIVSQPFWYWMGKNHERDIKAMKGAGRVMRAEQQSDMIKEGTPDRPSWLAPDDNVKPFPTVTEYSDDQLVNLLRHALADNGDHPLLLPQLRKIKEIIKMQERED
jgi:hypothetical protein